LSEHVRVERRDGVLSITLNRPERRNAITVDMYAALADAIEAATGDDAIRLVTIRGEGQDFAAGNDLGDFLKALPASGGCFGLLRRAKRRWSPRFTAIAWASARRCCFIATS
jgi:enoyl-CoA hydratase/carnithine racemase